MKEKDGHVHGFRDGWLDVVDCSSVVTSRKCLMQLLWKKKGLSQPLITHSYQYFKHLQSIFWNKLIAV